jgi:hypothetical protein
MLTLSVTIFFFIIVLSINRQGDISNNLNLHFSNDFQLKTAKNMNNNMYSYGIKISGSIVNVMI